MSSVFDRDILTCLSAVERKSEACVATSVPQRGANDFVVGLAYQALDKWGMNNDNLVLQCDREETVVNTMQAVARKRTASTKLRKTPVGLKGSLRYAEQLHRSLEGLTRTFRGQIESSCTVTIGSDNEIAQWLGHASFVLTCVNVKANGETAHEMLHNPCTLR